MNHLKMPKDVVKKRMEEARVHLKFTCEIYNDRHRRGKWFLHEHPALATSWGELSIKKILKLSGVDSIRADQCKFGLVTPSDGGPKPALKPTRFMSKSPEMLMHPSRKCDRIRKHQPLVSGRCAAAAFYPRGLVRAILRGIRDTLKFHKAMQSDIEKSRRAVMAMAISVSGANVTSNEKSGNLGVTGITKLDGGTLKLNLEDGNFKAKYFDEYTGEELPRHLVIEAMIEELSYFNDREVCKATSRRAAKVTEGGTHARMKWVLCNKGDEANPAVRARLVACEVAMDKQPSFFALTPPWEAKRLLFYRYSKERARDNEPLQILLLT